MSILIKDAQQVLINNRKRGYTLPTNNKLYPAQWNWDSAFISIGWLEPEGSSLALADAVLDKASPMIRTKNSHVAKVLIL